MVGRLLVAEQHVAQIDAIDAGMVKNYAAQVMQSVSPAIAAVGPVAKLESHDTFARRFGALANAAE